MTLKLTPKTLEAAYEYLRSTDPFRRWRLPSGASVEFLALPVQYYGHCEGPRRKTRARKKFYRWSIAISTRKIGHTYSLMAVMAHEMIHMRAGRSHGKMFKHYAAQVCRRHGFDPKEL